MALGAVCRSTIEPARICTERLVKQPAMYREFDLKRNHFRLSVGPEIAIALGMNLVALVPSPWPGRLRSNEC